MIAVTPLLLVLGLYGAIVAVLTMALGRHHSRPDTTP